MLTDEGDMDSRVFRSKEAGTAIWTNSLSISGWFVSALISGSKVLAKRKYPFSMRMKLAGRHPSFAGY